MTYAHRTSLPHRQKGMTIVEIMIAATISLILLTGVLQIFISNKQTYRINDAMSRVQENARFATHVLTSDIRMAGFAGCASKALSGANNIVDLDGDGVPDDVGNLTGGGLNGHEYGDLPITHLTADEVVNGTDVIVLQKALGNGVSLTGNMATENANVQIDASADGLFAADDVLVLADCTGSADIFAATNVSQGAGKITIAHASSSNTTPMLNKAYGGDAQLMKMGTTLLYVGTNADTGNTGLWRKRLIGSTMVTEELVEGIESMQIVYGERTGSNIKFVSADSVGDMDDVVAVRIALLLRTMDEVASGADTNTYDLVGTTVDPADLRVLRRIVTTTIELRNRGL